MSETTVTIASLSLALCQISPIRDLTVSLVTLSLALGQVNHVRDLTVYDHFRLPCIRSAMSET